MMLLIFVVIFTVFLLPSTASSNHLFREYNRRIWNGAISKPGQFPFDAHVISKTGDLYHLCTGALLSDEWVLTAAHCGNESDPMEIKLGAHNPDNENESGRVTDTGAKIFHHPKYPTSPVVYVPRDDLALVKLSNKIKFTNRIKPVLLPKATNDLYVGREVIASGWGTSDLNSPDLKWTTLRIIPNAECIKYFSEQDAASDTTICAKGSKLQSTCDGDSGGPLILKSDNRTLVGISRYRHSDGCHLGKPVGFARITYYLPWITKITGISPT